MRHIMTHRWVSITTRISLLGGESKMMPAEGASHTKTSAGRVVLLLKKNKQ